MQEQSIAQCLSHAEKIVLRARAALVNPTPLAIEACEIEIAELPALIVRTQALMSNPLCGEPERTLLSELRRSLHSLRCLLGGSAEFYSGWLQLAGAKLAGYQQNGAAASIERTSHPVAEA